MTLSIGGCLSHPGRPQCRGVSLILVCHALVRLGRGELVCWGWAPVQVSQLGPESTGSVCPTTCRAESIPSTGAVELHPQSMLFAGLGEMEACAVGWGGVDACC